VSWYPSAPNLHDALTVVAWAAGAVHWGVNSWHEPPAEYWPSGTTPFGDGRAVDTPLAGPAADGRYTTVLGPFDGTARVDEVDFVVHYADDTWSRPDQVAAIDHEPAVLPSVEIAEPEDGAVVSGTVRLVAAAADDGAAPAVQFLVDGSPLATIAARPYEADWDTTTVAEGAHTLAARADDGAGHSAEDSASVTVRRGGTTEECTVPSTADADADGDGDADADADAPLDGLGAEDADAPFDGLGAEDADARREDGGATDAAGDGPGADGGNAGCSCRAAPAGGAGIGIALLAAIALRRRRCRTLPRPVHSAPQVRDQRVDVDVDVDADDSGRRAQVAHADAHADVHGGSPEVPRGCTEARGSAPGGG
jgi:MYXO-CTERM domain-containing protein